MFCLKSGGDKAGTVLAAAVGMLAYERLDVYRCSVEFLAASVALIHALPKGNASLADQLRRAGMSIPLNIAEAAGKTTAADRRRFSAIARGSAMECGAILDVCVVLGVADHDEVERAKALLVRIVSMLTKMCR